MQCGNQNDHFVLWFFLYRFITNHMMIFRGVSRGNYAAAIAPMNTANCMEHGPTWEASSAPKFSKKVLECYRARCSVAMSTRSVHLSVSSYRWIHSAQWHPAVVRFILILSLHLLPKLSAISGCIFWLLVSRNANYELRLDLGYQHCYKYGSHNPIVFVRCLFSRSIQTVNDIIFIYSSHSLLCGW